MPSEHQQKYIRRKQASPQKGADRPPKGTLLRDTTPSRSPPKASTLAGSLVLQPNQLIARGEQGERWVLVHSSIREHVTYYAGLICNVVVLAVWAVDGPFEVFAFFFKVLWCLRLFFGWLGDIDLVVAFRLANLCRDGCGWAVFGIDGFLFM